LFSLFPSFFYPFTRDGKDESAGKSAGPTLRLPLAPPLGRISLAPQRNFCTMQPPYTSASLFTIGHSNLDLTDFLKILVQHEVKVLCDVRSRPGSFRHPQFNREPLEACLSSAQIHYEFLGEALGGRPSDPGAYHADGLVNYEARRKARDFCGGLDSALEMSRTAKIALTCAEEDPLHCHRFLMICPALVERGAVPLHIRRGGLLESQCEAEDRLLKLHDLGGFTSDSLFVSERASAIEEALRRQASEFAFRASPEAIEYY
jgi:hypothetical protein